MTRRANRRLECEIHRDTWTTPSGRGGVPRRGPRREANLCRAGEAVPADQVRGSVRRGGSGGPDRTTALVIRVPPETSIIVGRADRRTGAGLLTADKR